MNFKELKEQIEKYPHAIEWNQGAVNTAFRDRNINEQERDYLLKLSSGEEKKERINKLQSFGFNVNPKDKDVEWIIEDEIWAHKYVEKLLYSLSREDISLGIHKFKKFLERLPKSLSRYLRQLGNYKSKSEGGLIIRDIFSENLFGHPEAIVFQDYDYEKKEFIIRIIDKTGNIWVPGAHNRYRIISLRNLIDLNLGLSFKEIMHLLELFKKSNDHEEIYVLLKVIVPYILSEKEVNEHCEIKNKAEIIKIIEKNYLKILEAYYNTRSDILGFGYKLIMFLNLGLDNKFLNPKKLSKFISKLYILDHYEEYRWVTRPNNKKLKKWDNLSFYEYICFIDKNRSFLNRYLNKNEGIKVLNLYFGFFDEKLDEYDNEGKINSTDLKEIKNIEELTPISFLKSFYKKKEEFFGKFSVGDFVTIPGSENPDYIYKIAKSKWGGFILIDLMNSHQGGSILLKDKYKREILFKSNQLDHYRFDKKYRDINFLIKKGFLVVSSAIAFTFGDYGFKNLSKTEEYEYEKLLYEYEKLLDFGPGFKSLGKLANTLKSMNHNNEVSYPFSASSIYPGSKNGIAIHEDVKRFGAVGYVFGGGLIQYAYLTDTRTENLSDFHRKSKRFSDLEVPAEAAIKIDKPIHQSFSVFPYNELAVGKAKIIGLFYTSPNAEKNYSSMVKNICYDFKLDLYVIKEGEWSWKIYKYKDYKDEWKKINDIIAKQVEELQKAA